MKQKLFSLCTLLSITLMICVTGCAGRVSLNNQANQTLSPENYKTVKTACKGTSYGFRLLGIIPFASPNYTTARVNLIESAQAALIKSTGDKKWAEVPLVATNERADNSVIYLLLFSIPKKSIVADVGVTSSTAQVPNLSPTKTEAGLVLPPAGQSLTQKSPAPVR